jgi:hypothetical protein
MHESDGNTASLSPEPEEKTEARIVVAGHIPAENPTTDQGAKTPCDPLYLGSVFSSPFFRDNEQYPCHAEFVL